MVIRVVLTIVKASGTCDVVPMSGWLSESQAVAFLEEMATEAECVS